MLSRIWFSTTSVLETTNVRAGAFVIIFLFFLSGKRFPCFFFFSLRRSVIVFIVDECIIILIDR